MPSEFSKGCIILLSIDVEKVIGYDFNDLGLLREALTHPSHVDFLKKEESKKVEKLEACEEEDIVNGTQEGDARWRFKGRTPSLVKSYRRLEYIGDSILNLLMAKQFFSKYPELEPGMLTRLRAINSDTERLARVSIHFNLHPFLLHNNPSLNDKIRQFGKEISDYPDHSTGLVDPPKVLADIVESILGAVYVDSKFSIETTWNVVKTLLHPLITPKSFRVHPMTELNELCQKKGFDIKIYDSWDSTREILVSVNGGDIVGQGYCCSKKNIAQNRAADDACNQLIMVEMDERNVETLPDSV